MIPPKRPRRRSLSAEDKALWNHVSQTVRRTETDKKAPVEVPPEDQPLLAVKKTAAAKKYRTIAPPVTPQKSLPALPTLTHGDASGLDRKTAQRLKRGKLNIDETIDLHGHTQTAAHRTLERFLQSCFSDGKRTVLVITGKGDEFGGKPGVLKEAVPRWFNEMPMRQWVAGFSYAAPKDGGSGALYVRIRRKK